MPDDYKAKRIEFLQKSILMDYEMYEMAINITGTLIQRVDEIEKLKYKFW